MSQSKKRKRQSLTDRQSIEKMVSILQGTGCEFEVSLTNYTTQIKFADTGEKYLKTFRSRKCFQAYQKIKKDVSRYMRPEITEDEVRYYNHDITSEVSEAKAIQIDLKRAYATVLYNDGYIRPETYEYFNYISKQDRLAAVGMLASVKNLFYYNNGVIEEHDLIENPLKSFFFYCVKRVEEIMNVCRMEAVGNYLMTWVDAIYIKDDEGLAQEIKRVLLYNGFDCEISYLEEFKCMFQNHKIHVSMVSNGKKKSFYIPHTKNIQANHLVSFIISNNNKTLSGDIS